MWANSCNKFFKVDLDKPWNYQLYYPQIAPPLICRHFEMPGGQCPRSLKNSRCDTRHSGTLPPPIFLVPQNFVCLENFLLKHLIKTKYFPVAIGKARAACAQSFTLRQQATIEIMRRNHHPRALVIKFNRSHVNIDRVSPPQSLYCLLASHIYCCCSRTSRSWWITLSTQRQRRGCNNIPH